MTANMMRICQRGVFKLDDSRIVYKFSAYETLILKQ
jgi:hypothetical protein